MAIKDISPTFTIPTLENELSFPSDFSEATAQTVGGFLAGANALRHGNITINGTDEQFLIGEAEDFSTGIGLFMGKDTDDAYKFRLGDPEGSQLVWDGSSLNIVGFLEDGEAASDVNSNVTTINGGKITTETITATQLVKTSALITASAQISDAVITSAKIISIEADQISTQIVNAQIASIAFAKIDDVSITNAMISSLNADKLDGGTMSGISIKIGSDNNVFKADSGGIYLGNATFASAPFSVDMSGNVIAKSIYLWGTIATATGAMLRTSSGNDRIEFRNTDYIYFYKGGTLKGSLRAVTATNANGVVCSGDLVVPNNKSFVVAGTSSGDYMRLGVDSSNNTRLTLTDSNKLYIYNNDGDTPYMTLSSSRMYSEKNLWCGSRVGIDKDPDDFSEKLWVEGSCKITDNLKSDHHDPNGNKSYNLGGDDSAWDYVYYDTLVDKSMGWYDDGVDMQDGRHLTDLEALREIKPHPRLKTKNGTDIMVSKLDYNSLPKQILSVATDREGKPYPRNKDGDAISPTTGEVVGDGIRLNHFVALIFGGLKELTLKVESLEKQLNSSDRPNKVERI